MVNSSLQVRKLFKGSGANIATTWPGSINIDLEEGFTDKEIEKLCQPNEEHFEPGSLFKFGRSSWTTKIYGFDRIWRYLASWPEWLAMSVTSDHGVTFARDFEPHEKNLKFRVHLTWSRWRAERLIQGKRVVRIPHPWVLFRRSRGLEKRPDAMGTVVFVDHSTPNDHELDYSWDEYFSQLASLPEEFRAKALVIHSHDVTRGLHRELRRFGLPIFTLGHHHSPFFAERFYDLILRFRYLSSASIGSHILLAEEAGVQSFLYGERRALQIAERAPALLPAAQDCSKVFSNLPTGESPERFEALRDYLSVDLADTFSPASFRHLLLVELVWLQSRALLRRLSKTTRKLVRRFQMRVR